MSETVPTSPLAETDAGPAARGGSFGQVSKWWASKVAPVLAVAYLALLLAPRPPGEVAVRLVTLVGSACVLATSAYVVNDWFDREEDRAAGRAGTVADWSARRVALAVVVLVVAGLVPWTVVPVPPIGWIALGAIVVLPLVYSAPPLRWKERGGLGLLADAGLAHVAPTVFAFAVFDGFGAVDGVVSGILVGAVVSWSLWTGLRAIVGHELVDLGRDERFGVDTWVRRVGPARARWWAGRVLLPLEVASLAVAAGALAVVVPGAAIAFAVIVVGLGVGRLVGAYRVPWRAVPDAGDPRAVLWMFYRFWPAVVLAGMLAVRDRDLAWVVAGHLVLFAPVALGEARSFAVAVGGMAQAVGGFARYKVWWWLRERAGHAVASWLRYRLPEHVKMVRGRVRRAGVRAARAVGVRHRPRRRVTSEPRDRDAAGRSARDVPADR